MDDQFKEIISFYDGNFSRCNRLLFTDVIQIPQFLLDTETTTPICNAVKGNIILHPASGINNQRVVLSRVCFTVYYQQNHK